ncbi:efflux transporter outer membrane subunit [Pseudoduganella sp. FT55W]|uniref:Efflux transporter outer membrane subunit n=2 Tax=Duganella rivi TaxID=2666083 RepID=A0A7X4GP62_9BURK|nr:efflux transporter outer membrane subunit [Duganella rivi]
MLAACLASVLLAGCSHTKPMAEPLPAIELPAGWSQAGTAGSQEWPDNDWWQRFGSEELSQLVRDGQDSNLELAAALSRMRQAAAQARIAGVVLLPSVNAYAGASRDLPVGGNHNANVSTSGQLQVSYELDFWGKNAASAAAAEASLKANFYDRQTVALSVTSGIVSTYLQLLSLHDRLIVARENASTAERVLSLVEAQSSVGAATSVDLARQRSAVASQRAAIPALLQQQREAQSALAILLGRSPQTFSISDSGLGTIRLPEVTAGLPSELLSRRPDIQRSEAMLAAASANVEAARAALFPSIRLTGSTGTQSSALLSLLNAHNLFANVGASLVAPIFDGGRLRSERDLALEQKQELVQTYRSTVLAALAEVDTVLGQINSLDEQRRLKEVELEQSRLAFNLSEIRYKAGAEDLMTVLDTQRSLSDVQNELGMLKLKRLQATVSLYKALGGGWQAG